MAKIKYTYETTLSITVAIDTDDLLGEGGALPNPGSEEEWEMVDKGGDKAHEVASEFLETLAVGYPANLSADATLDGVTHERHEVVPDVVRPAKPRKIRRGNL